MPRLPFGNPGESEISQDSYRGGETPATISPSATVSIELSIVMPCLNEAETVATCVRKASDFLARHNVVGEIIVADNGSIDGSQQLATQAGARVVAVRDRGYGAALLGGFSAARGRFIIMGDSDDTYDFTNLMPFLERLREGYDLVVGNRFRGEIDDGAMPPLHRYLGNPLLSGIGRLFFGSKIGDFHCGLRGFRREALERMNLRTTGMELASEIVVKSTLQGLRVTEVPTTLRPDIRDRRPHLRTWRDGWRHLRFMLLYSPRWLFLYPGAALMLAGSVVGTWLLIAPRQIGGVELDVHTLLYAAAAILLGFQAILFAVVSKTFAITAGLVPEDQRMTRLFRVVTLEVGLLAGTVMILAGAGLSAYAMLLWRSRSFGELDYRITLRLIIPAVTTLALGTQVIFSSFLLSILGMKRRETLSEKHT